jgi:hypothetical protein
MPTVKTRNQAAELASRSHRAIGTNLALAQHDHEDAVAAFKQDADSDPLHAARWQTEKVARARGAWLARRDAYAAYGDCKHGDVVGEAIPEVTVERLARCAAWATRTLDDLLDRDAIGKGPSTCAITNEVERFHLAGKVKALVDIKRWAANRAKIIGGLLTDPTPEDAEGCPGCGNRPGAGVTDGCDHPLGCGFWRKIAADVARHLPGPASIA